MEREEILDGVARRADLDSEQAAEQATLATVETFGEHVSKGEAKDIAEYLPADISDATTSRSSESPEDFTVDEFVDRVVEREGGDVSEDEAVVHVRAVMATLADTGIANELQEAREQLPNEFATLFETDELQTE